MRKREGAMLPRFIAVDNIIHTLPGNFLPENGKETPSEKGVSFLKTLFENTFFKQTQ
jgi:hypothetical protein